MGGQEEIKGGEFLRPRAPKSDILPEIERRPKGFNAYDHYQVRTRRGVKHAAKKEWADRVVEHLVGKGLL